MFHFIIKPYPFAVFPFFNFVGLSNMPLSCSGGVRCSHVLSPLAFFFAFCFELKCCLFYCHFPLYEAPAIYSLFYTEINGQRTDFIRNNRVSYRPFGIALVCAFLCFFVLFILYISAHMTIQTELRTRFSLVYRKSVIGMHFVILT